MWSSGKGCAQLSPNLCTAAPSQLGMVGIQSCARRAELCPGSILCFALWLQSELLPALQKAGSGKSERFRLSLSPPSPFLTKQTAPSSARTSFSAQCVVRSRLLLRTKSRSYLALKNNHSDSTSLSPADSVVNTFRQLSDSLSV